MYGTTNPLDELKSFFRKGSALSVLIAINLAVWVLAKGIAVVFFLYNRPGPDAADSFLLHLLALPASIPGLLHRPWSIVTYMFFHLDFWHILFNMLWLYWFGKIFLRYLGTRQLTSVYLLGGLAGGALYLIAFNIFPVFGLQREVSMALGASAAVMAVVTAIAFHAPYYSLQLIFIGRVKIIYLAIVLFVFDFFAIPGSNSGGHIAHIGGAVYGFIWAMTRTQTVGTPFSALFGNLASTFRNRFAFRKKQRPDPRNHYQSRPKTDVEYNAEKAEKQRRIDAILDKISKGGYESLSKEEKEFLFSSTNKNG